MPAGGGHASLVASPDPLTVWAVDYNYGLVDGFRLDTLQHQVTIPIGAKPHGAAYSEMLGTVYFATDDGIYEIGASGDLYGVALRHLPISDVEGARTGYIETRHDGRYIYGTIAATNELFLLDLMDGSVRYTALAGTPVGFAFSSDDKWVAVAQRNAPVIQVVETDLTKHVNRRTVRKIDLTREIGNIGIRGIAVTPDNSAIYVTAGEFVLILSPQGRPPP